jgi:hypothetical protein
MKLSEAIIEGSKFRPAVGALGERFSNVEGRGLSSDVWGAACEAVQPAVAKFNWNPLSIYAFERAMDAFRAVQLQYFASYFQMPAKCPGARRSISQVGGRLLRRFGREPELKTYDDHARTQYVSGITTECDKVEHLAGLIDHLYHKHRMSREDIAKCVEEYEQARERGLKQQFVVNRNFNHYTANWR